MEFLCGIQKYYFPMFGSSAIYSSGDFLGLVYPLNAPHPMSFGEALVKADISGLLLTNFLKLWVWGGFSLECTIDVATLAGFPNLSLFIIQKCGLELGSW